jgi:hypothetical protein
LPPRLQNVRISWCSSGGETERSPPYSPDMAPAGARSGEYGGWTSFCYFNVTLSINFLPLINIRRFLLVSNVLSFFQISFLRSMHVEISPPSNPNMS